MMHQDHGANDIEGWGGDCFPDQDDIGDGGGGCIERADEIAGK